MCNIELLKLESINIQTYNKLQLPVPLNFIESQIVLQNVSTYLNVSKLGFNVVCVLL